MSEQSKPRDIYLDHSNWYSSEEVESSQGTEYQLNKNNLIHFIEYQAYTQALERIAKLEMQNKLMRDALEFYKNGQHIREYCFGQQVILEEEECERVTRRAYQALKDVEGVG